MCRRDGLSLVERRGGERESSGLGLGLGVGVGVGLRRVGGVGVVEASVMSGS